MTARRAPAAHLCLRVGSRHEVAFVPFPAKAPMFVIGAASTLVSFTLPEHLDAGHVDFARQLAAKAWAYAVAVERRYRGLPPLPDVPVPYTLTAQRRSAARCRAGAGGPGAAARRAGGDGMTATSASVRFSASGVTGVDAFVRLTGHSHISCCVYDDIAPILAVRDAHVDISITVPGRDQVTADDLAMARLLADAAGQYAAELEKFAATNPATAAGTDEPAGRAA